MDKQLYLKIRNTANQHAKHNCRSAIPGGSFDSIILVTVNHPQTVYKRHRLEYAYMDTRAKTVGWWSGGVVSGDGRGQMPLTTVMGDVVWYVDLLICSFLFCDR